VEFRHTHKTYIEASAVVRIKKACTASKMSEQSCGSGAPRPHVYVISAIDRIIKTMERQHSKLSRLFDHIIKKESATPETITTKCTTQKSETKTGAAKIIYCIIVLIFLPASSFKCFFPVLLCLSPPFSSHLAANHAGAMVAKLTPKQMTKRIATRLMSLLTFSSRARAIRWSPSTLCPHSSRRSIISSVSSFVLYCV